MKINKKWLKDNFEHKFYKLTNKCEFSVKKFSQLENKQYIRRIKIEEID